MRFPELGERIIGKINLKETRSSVDWQKTVKSIRQRTNNEELLNVLRLISTDFSISEINNNSGINLNNWYKIISVVRHSITHADSVLSIDVYNGLGKDGQKLLKKFFSYEKSNDDGFTLSLSKSQINGLFKIMAEYGFLIYKCLSIEAGTTWRILKDLN
jgi:hypothetical protein